MLFFLMREKEVGKGPMAPKTARSQMAHKEKNDCSEAARNDPEDYTNDTKKKKWAAANPR